MEDFETNDSYAENLEAQLQMLVKSAQENPSLSQHRQQALEALIKTVLRSRQLWYPRSEQFYPEVYDEALQNLWLYVCQELDRYDAKLGRVMAWLNMLLRRRFYPEAYSQFSKYYYKRVENLARLSSEVILTDNSILLSQKIKECVELDPEGIFQQSHIENNARANFQELLRRRLSGQKWSDISQELEIGVSTLSNFYQKCIKKYSQKFQEYLR